jgi:YesN/AraC family two-component response regulator
MPVLGGRDAARIVRENRPDIRVLFMSGYSEFDIIDPGGFSDAGFIGKPFTPQELENAVRAAIDAVPAAQA